MVDHHGIHVVCIGGRTVTARSMAKSDWASLLDRTTDADRRAERIREAIHAHRTRPGGDLTPRAE